MRSRCMLLFWMVKNLSQFLTSLWLVLSSPHSPIVGRNSFFSSLNYAVTKHNNYVFKIYRNSKSKTYSNSAVNDKNYNNNNTSECNCRHSNHCPLQNNCLVSSLVYLGIFLHFKSRVLIISTLEALKSCLKPDGIIMY